MRLGGKIFTTWPGSSKANLGIEFVPGFKELNPNKNIKDDELKESADFGNMTSLCHLVSQLLNSFAYAGINNIRWSNEGGKDKAEDLTSNAVSANKDFLSDEGGRPGIMELNIP